MNSSVRRLVLQRLLQHTLVVRHPDMDFAKLNLGIFYANLTEFFARDDKDFRDAVAKSRAALQRTLQINKQYPEAYYTLGRLEVLFSGHPESPAVFAGGAAAESEICKGKGAIG